MEIVYLHELMVYIGAGIVTRLVRRYRTIVVWSTRSSLWE